MLLKPTAPAISEMESCDLRCINLADSVMRYFIRYSKGDRPVERLKQRQHSLLLTRMESAMSFNVMGSIDHCLFHSLGILIGNARSNFIRSGSSVREPVVEQLPKLKND